MAVVWVFQWGSNGPERLLTDMPSPLRDGSAEFVRYYSHSLVLVKEEKQGRRLPSSTNKPILISILHSTPQGTLTDSRT
jgi:hypothetical protein